MKRSTYERLATYSSTISSTSSSSSTSLSPSASASSASSSSILATMSANSDFAAIQSSRIRRSSNADDSRRPSIITRAFLRPTRLEVLASRNWPNSTSAAASTSTPESTTCCDSPAKFDIVSNSKIRRHIRRTARRHATHRRVRLSPATLLQTSISRIDAARLLLVQTHHTLHLARHLPALLELLHLLDAFVASRIHLGRRLVTRIRSTVIATYLDRFRWRILAIRHLRLRLRSASSPRCTRRTYLASHFDINVCNGCLRRLPTDVRPVRRF